MDTIENLNAGATLIEVRGLSKIYGTGVAQVRALNHVSLSIHAGEFTALMGPSGSGKTTLLNLIAGIDDASEGNIVIDGVDIAQLSDAKRTAWRTRNIGYIFQSYNLMPVLTAYENVELPLLLLKMSAYQRREHVMTALEAVNLLDRAHHKPTQMSGGQQQRVAIARALVADARIMIADEPTGNLDAASEIEVLTILRRLNEEFGKTLVMVTHDQSAASFAKRIIHLEKGIITNHNAVLEGK